MKKRGVQEGDGESGRREKDTRENKGDRREDKKNHRKLQKGKKRKTEGVGGMRNARRGKR